jgi:Protein of unknown function (DUF3572)
MLKSSAGNAGPDGEEIAIRILGWLADEPERFQRFLSLTGIDPGDLRAMARETSFHHALMDHLLGDDALLQLFAAEQGLDPGIVAKARGPA